MAAHKVSMDPLIGAADAGPSRCSSRRATVPSAHRCSVVTESVGCAQRSPCAECERSVHTACTRLQHSQGA